MGPLFLSSYEVMQVECTAVVATELDPGDMYSTEETNGNQYTVKGEQHA